MAHMVSIFSIFVTGTIIEGIVILVIIVLWGAAIGVITDVDNDLAVDENGSVKNGNLFYFRYVYILSFFKIFFTLNFCMEKHLKL